MGHPLEDIQGVSIGHAQDVSALTGCTVIYCRDGAVAGVDQRGGAPGTRETDALRPMHLVNIVHAVILSGGSAFGLDAASGVMQYLEENKIGYNTGIIKIPIVASAILYDLGIGNKNIRPDRGMGYQACLNSSILPVAEGNIGAGTGATVGKILGIKQAMKSGIGISCIDAGGGVLVGAIVAVNAFGDVINPENGKILAGARVLHLGPSTIGKGPVFADTQELMRSWSGRLPLKLASMQNTVIGVVITNARVSNVEANKIAQMAHNGIARTVRPAHTMLDGDTIFCMATMKKKADVNIVGAFAVEAVSQAIIRAVMKSEKVGFLESYKSLQSSINSVQP